MLPASIICFLALTLFCGLLAWAAVSDFRRYLIPNQVSLGALALYPVFVLSAPTTVQWEWSIAIAAGCFAVAFGLYLARALGAGDAKLLPVVVLWAGPKNIALFVLALALSSVVLAAIAGLRAAIAQVKTNPVTEKAGTAALELSGVARLRRTLGGFGLQQFLRVKLPYGVAIAAGGIVVAVYTMFTTHR